jgi:serine/threonine-protein kinase
MTTASTGSNLKVLNALPSDAWTDAYLAQAPGHAKPVCLRMLKAEASADEARVERFLAGAKALILLRHGAVLAVHAAGKTREGRPYILTDAPEGDTLASRGSMPLEDIIDIGVPLSDALGAAHQANLVHGALSPSRVLLTNDGPKLDFSLAPLLREDGADAANDIRTLAAMLQAHVSTGEERASFDSSLRRALAGMPDARGLRDRLVTLRGRWQEDTRVSSPGVKETSQAGYVMPPAEGDAPIEDPDLTGQQLGNYEVLKIIGEGAMGRVYLCRHSRIGRQAAIKVLKAEHARSRELVQRFIQEATAVNAIKNEHIVEVYDFGEEKLGDGTPRVYCVMELLEGTSLADDMYSKPVKVQRAARIAQQMARALGAAHAVGVVHRDIKPDNIFLQTKPGRDDFVKVLDFGVAKLLKPIGELPKSGTQAGIVIGTPEYMAPEQALGLGTDFHVDVYAVGLVLYEMLTGNQPFTGETFGKLVVEITSRPVPPIGRNSKSGEFLPRGLSDVAMKCLAKKPEDRYASSEELAQALEEYASPRRLGESGILNVKTLPDNEAIAAMRPHPGRTLLIVGLLVAMVGGGAFWALKPYDKALDEPQQPKAVVVEPPRAPEKVTLDVSSEPSGAKVTRVDTGEVLGVTPLKAELDRAETQVALRLELEGRQHAERSVSLAANSALSVDLQPLPAPAAVAAPEKPEKKPEPPKKRPEKKAPVSRDGVVDPFAN